MNSKCLFGGVSAALAMSLTFAGNLAVASDAVTDDADLTTYRCDAGERITTVSRSSGDDDPIVILSVAGDPTRQQIEMLAVVSANGNTYSNGALVWWTKGDEGFLSEDDPPDGSGEILIGGCRAMPSAR